MYFRERQGFEELPSAPQRADMWSVEFVGRTDEEVAVPLVYISEVMRDIVDGIDE